ncbi:MAG: hypothetical protein M1821_001740 [Bathelium mastoideum]|nr:MAG: hypothetical protein M1821_001740 [Bathelium mastoideum]KAI9691638.1 MAG: hypothetical protein M1822_007709 [Bathelium mastoideum]
MSAWLEGKTCIITGSGGGLGRAIAAAFLNAHANVVICDINNERLESASKELTPQGSLLAVQTDLASSTSIQNLFDSAVNKFGQIDVLVNNAGIMDHFRPVGDLDRATWDRVLAVNLTAPYELSKRAINHTLGRENGKAAIVNVGSISAVTGFRAGAAYTASKHGLVGLTKNIAAYYGKKGIRCNAVLPGMMQTNIGETAFPDKHDEALGVVQRSCAVEPGMCDLAEVANTVLYLCSDQSNVVNGAVVNVDHGWAAY